MIKELFSDITAACSFYSQRRKARNSLVLPVYNPGPAYYNTVEGCRLGNCGRKTDKAGLMAFKAMPYEMQRSMEFAPSTGEFIERARQWQMFLRQVTPGKDGHAAMVGILSWYRHIKHRKRKCA